MPLCLQNGVCFSKQNSFPHLLFRGLSLNEKLTSFERYCLKLLTVLVSCFDNIYLIQIDSETLL